MIDDTATLGEAKDWLRARVDHGHACPCCNQFAKVYRRTIHSAMARDLIVALRRYEEDFFFLPDLTGKRGTGDVTKCRYWGLFQQAEGKRDDGSTRNGYWRVTGKGREFALDRTKLPKYVHLYDGQPLRLSGEPVTIRDCLGTRFNYDDLMRGI